MSLHIILIIFMLTENYDYGFVIDSMIGEKPKVLTVHFTLRHGSNIKQVTANTNLGTVTFKSSEIRKGQVKYVTTAANTMFWK